MALLDVFFGEAALRLGGLVVPDKLALDYERFARNHDALCYKRLYALLNRVIHRDKRYRFFVRRTGEAEVLRESCAGAFLWLFALVTLGDRGVHCGGRN